MSIGSARAADTLTQQVLVNFDGTLTDTTYTLGVGEIDTTSSFKGNGTPVITDGMAALDPVIDGFDFNPTSLGSLNTQSWVAETLLTLDTHQSWGTLIDVYGEANVRINLASTLLEYGYYNGSSVASGTAALPPVGPLLHIAMVWDAANTALTVYLDGDPLGTVSGGTIAVADGTNVSFGYFGRLNFDNRGMDGSLDAVAFSTFTGSFDSATDFSLYTPPMFDALYWDVDGATAGAGGEAPEGNWSDANWSDSAAGDIATTNWSPGKVAIFSAGTNATGVYNVTLTGTETVDAVRLEEGSLELVGGTVDLGMSGSLYAKTDAELTVSSDLTATSLESRGEVYLYGESSITNLNIISGALITDTDINLTLASLIGFGEIDSGGDLTVGGPSDFSFSGRIMGPGNLIKQGTGKWTIQNIASNIMGNVMVSGGTLETGTTPGNGSTSCLGNVNGERTVTVSNGATLQFVSSNVFGGGGKTSANIPMIIVDGGTLRSQSFNILGNTTLRDGGTLLNASMDPSPSYDGFQLLGSITAAGSGAACSISNDASSEAVHLLGAGANSFIVEDLTGDTTADLTIASPLRDGSGDFPGVGSLTKSGAGTLLLSGVNTYTGTTTVSEGVLAVNGSSLSNDSTLVINGGVVDVTGNETVGTLMIGGIQQPPGTYGAPGSAARTIDSVNFSGTGVVIVPGGDGYTDWASGFAALTDTNPELDFDLDGLPTGIEWVVAGDPTLTDSASIAPSIDNTTDPNKLLYTFRRSDLANADTNTSITVQYGSDLLGWTTAVDGVDNITISVNDDGAATGVDLITVGIPRTLATGGKLFVRLQVDITGGL